MNKVEVPSFIGCTITGTRKMTDEEMEENDWGGHGTNEVIQLSDGTEIYAMMDPEGNGPGQLIRRLKNGTEHYI